ncbi:MAG: sle [Frankiales bacterium]|nr:sle [Frankiales bacterium]
MSATAEPVAWNGSWVADRLGAALVADSGFGGLTVHHLVGLALRVNPRRSHLLVSRVLGKHLPADPLLVQGAGRLLGAAVADLLSGRDSGTPQAGGRLLAAALSGEPSASLRLLALCDEHRDAAAPADALVLGFAETATGLGHTVADALGADYLHSTRRPVGGVAAVGAFEEVHSHATSHLLLPEDPAFVAGPRPLVLVDDELSTGATVMNTVRAVHAIAPRTRYVIAGLVDLRSDADRQELTDFAARTGVRMDVVALASGRIELPADAPARGQELATRYGRPAAGAGRPAPAGRIRPAPPRGRWPDRVRDGGRHGFPRAERAPFDAAVREVATALLPAVLPTLPSGRRARLLVLGTEELMYLPMRIAAELAGRLRPAGAEVVFSTTTRSPVVAVDDAGYAIRTALAFGSHDDPADGPGPRYAYNVAPGEGQEPFDAAVLVVDACSTAWPAEGPRLPDVLAGVVAGPVTVVTVPSHRAGSGFPAPLHGPGFGSYRADEVGWLLTDLSDAELEAPVEEREEAIQAGTAHYAESLPVEYQPTPEYQRLFARTLASSAATLAHAVGLVTELVLAERGPEPVLVSLARAGTPVGILMRRWAEFAHGRTLPHYAVSIVRGRGIDRVALAYLAAAHDPASVVFVDGWTGKGAIARELAAALADANAAMGLPSGRRFSPELAVLADPGHCVRTFGTRADFLIPSACLNSTVSGLVSRTVLNDELIGPGQFHGAKFYADLAGADVSRKFLDAVSSAFPAVADRVAAELPTLAAADRTPTWAGWSTVERLAAHYGVGNVNLVKPGVGETTRVLLRRVPWKVLLRRDAASSLEHVLLLAEQRGAEVELVDDMPYSCVGIVRPGFTRGGRASSGPGRATTTDLLRTC